MADAHPTQITTSLSHISHLLVLVSHYLSLRLPAEVTLPHRGYPLPTIFPPAASYMSREVQFPGTSPTHSSSSSPTASRSADTRQLPRPRPLFMDRGLPKLAKEEPATYNLLLEGVALLAWNIAWVCRTQGLNTGSESWEDVCNMGRNLWQLLVSPPSQASTLMRVLSSRESSSKSKAAKDTPRATMQRTKSFPILGHYSHGTAHSFLGGAEGTEFMRTWKLPSPVRVTDKLKSTLLGEMTSAEWELVEEDEWDDEEVNNPLNNNRDGEAGPAPPASQEPFDDASMIATKFISHEDGVNDAHANGQAGDESNTAPRGNSGWTKLKNR